MERQQSNRDNLYSLITSLPDKSDRMLRQGDGLPSKMAKIARPSKMEVHQPLLHKILPLRLVVLQALLRILRQRPPMKNWRRERNGKRNKPKPLRRSRPARDSRGASVILTMRMTLPSQSMKNAPALFQARWITVPSAESASP